MGMGGGGWHAAVVVNSEENVKVSVTLKMCHGQCQGQSALATEKRENRKKTAFRVGEPSSQQDNPRVVQ